MALRNKSQGIILGIKHWDLRGYLKFLPRIKFGVSVQEIAHNLAKRSHELKANNPQRFHSVPPREVHPILAGGHLNRRYMYSLETIKNESLTNLT